MTTRQSTTRTGVYEAWTWWLDNHDISVPEIIEDAIEAAVKRWLDQHQDELIAAIAERAAEDVRSR